MQQHCVSRWNIYIYILQKMIHGPSNVNVKFNNIFSMCTVYIFKCSGFLMIATGCSQSIYRYCDQILEQTCLSNLFLNLLSFLSCIMYYVSLATTTSVTVFCFLGVGRTVILQCKLFNKVDMTHCFYLCQYFIFFYFAILYYTYSY